jgi:hypothetical protein
MLKTQSTIESCPARQKAQPTFDAAKFGVFLRISRFDPIQPRDLCNGRADEAIAADSVPSLRSKENGAVVLRICCGDCPVRRSETGCPTFKQLSTRMPYRACNLWPVRDAIRVVGPSVADTPEVQPAFKLSSLGQSRTTLSWAGPLTQLTLDRLNRYEAPLGSVSSRGSPHSRESHASGHATRHYLYDLTSLLYRDDCLRAGLALLTPGLDGETGGQLWVRQRCHLHSNNAHDRKYAWIAFQAG